MTRRVGCSAAFLMVALLAAGHAEAQEYRGFWVDTFNTALNNHNDVLAVVNNAKAVTANAILAQVRRRGDSWYLNSLEPAPDFVPLEPGFDALADLIATAHAEGMEVHAFVIMSAIWSKNPNFAPTATLGPPISPEHVFNRHGGHNGIRSSAGAITDLGPNNWLTRTLLPDGAAGIAFQGHRFGSDFWLDFGHPDAAAYTVDVVMHLVRNYDIDGLHLDRIRYPEIGIAGQTPATGVSIGYNSTSIARFQRRYGIPAGSEPPARNNADWSQWRRDQVTNVVRRIYLNAMAIKPQLKISAALIVFGGAPATEAGWTTSIAAEAYWRVFQDWRAWTEEGIIDLAMPMNYKREHTRNAAGVFTEQPLFNSWLEWTRNHQYNRAALIGQGAFLNSIEGTLPQVRRSLDPSPVTGNRVAGVVFFSMATSNVAVTSNPLSIPAGQNTPLRPFAEFASGLTTGKSANGLVQYEDATLPPLFSAPARVPLLPWKENPQVGHIKGFVTDEAGNVVDSGAIRIERQSSEAPAGRTLVMNATDGGGFYGGVDLVPGTYRVTVTPVGGEPYTTACSADVTIGAVTTFDIAIDRVAPSTTIAADPAQIWPPSGEDVMVTVSGEATDTGTGIASIAFRVIDEYGEVEPLVATETAAGASPLNWSRQVPLQASRRGDDRDGRTYTVEATITDRACNTHVVKTTAVVAHDQRRGGE